MKKRITHSCGHEGVYDFFGSGAERDRKVWVLEHSECPECRRAKVQEWAGGQGLPALQGTEKQVAWAEEIRREQIVKAEGIMERSKDTAKEWDLALAAMASLREQASARWWIAHKDGIALKEEMLRIRQEADVTPAEAAAQAEAVLEPEGEQVPILCKVGHGERCIWVKSDYHKDIPDILKGLGMRWNPQDRRWERTITSMTGAMDDRMAEAANRLLAGGFPVQLDPELFEKAAFGTFEREHKRWVGKEDGSTVFLTWPKGDKIYSEIMSLPWARMGKGKAYVSVAAKKELEDFAEINGFRITEKAMAVLDAYQPETVKVLEKARKKEGEDAAQKLRDILESSRDILDDLREEE